MTFDAVLIAGPTASGKSAAALALADHIGGAIINADSMQVYAEAPILTAQPDAAARARAPHLLYGHVSAREGLFRRPLCHRRGGGAGRGAGDGQGADLRRRHRLYFTALTEGLADIPATPPQVRAAARALLAEIGVEELHHRLMARDPRDRGGACARPIPSACCAPTRCSRRQDARSSNGRRRRPLPLLKDLKLAAFVLAPPREVLRARIATRFETMMDNGAMEEARVLQDLDPALPAARLLGLGPLGGLAAGTVTRQDAVALAVTATRQFAKRQMTWFRHRMADYVWVNPCDSNIITVFDDMAA